MSVILLLPDAMRQATSEGSWYLNIAEADKIRDFIQR